MGAAGIVLVCACGSVNQSADAGHDTGMPDAMCTPETEVLDGKDNDCNGLVDEGFWTTVIQTPIAALTARDPGCADGAAIAADAYACQLAVRRECQARGYAAGFRPAELSSTEVAFTCVADVRMISAVSYAELSRYIPSCTPENAFKTHCFAAIKRYCHDKGFKTGIGPLNVDTQASVDLLCTDHAEHVPISLELLRMMEDKTCNIPTSQPWDFSCFHDYHRYCRSLGWTAAWGPVEFDGTTTVYAACLAARPRS